MIVTEGAHPLRVLLLGPPVVQWMGAPLALPGRMTRALLFLLASQGGQVHQEELAHLVWGDSAAAHRRLKDHLTRLQNLLPQPAILQVGPERVGIDFSQAYVDQLDFQNRIDRAGHDPWRKIAGQPLDEATASLLAGAAALWHGPHFLAGIKLPASAGLEAWYERTQQHLEGLYQRVLERLADHSFATGALESAGQYARLALVYNELDEDLHYQVLRSLIYLGKPSEAREYFDYVQNLLRKNLDASPGARLVELYRQIYAEETAPQRFIPAPRWPLHTTLSAPFVGRQRVLATLQRNYVRGGGVFIFGESGQGKTRLMQEFSRKVVPTPRLLLTFSRPAENNLPFQPLIEVLRNQILADEWLALPPTWAGQLALLLPELVEMQPGRIKPAQVELSTDATPDLARASLMEAIRQLFLLIADREPLLFCLDDAQWTDEATLETLAYLLARPPFDHRALLLVSARSEEKNPALEKVITALPQSENISVIHLAHLSLDEITTLCEHILDRTLGPAFMGRMAKETGGNPLFILEILRALLARSSPFDPEGLEDLKGTDSLQTLILARLQQLSPLAHEVLEVAAVVGVEFSTEVIGQAGQKSSLEIMSALEELEQSLLVEARSYAPQDIRYCFIHNQIRETLLAGLSPLRLQWLHSRVAATLENRLRNQASSQAAILAQHFELAGELSKAFDYWVRAVRRARQLFALDAAQAACQRAEALISQATDLLDDQIHSLYTEWIELAYEIEDATTLWRLGNDLLELGQESESPLLTGTGLNSLCCACMVNNRFQDGLEYANQAIASLEKEEYVYEQMAAYIHQGVFSYMLNRIEDAIAAFQDALSLGLNSGDPLVMHARANAHYQMSIALTLSGLPESGLNHANHSLADFSRLNRAHGQVTAYSALAIGNYFSGNYAQACKDSQAGLEIAERLHAGRMLGYLHGYRSMLEMVTGNPDGALEHAEIAVKIGERYGHDEIIASGHRLIGDIFLGFGAYAKALEHYRFSFELTNGRFLATDQQFRMGLCMARTGQVESGMEHIQQSIQISQKAGMVVFAVMAQLCLCYVYPMLGEWGQAYQTALQVLKETSRRKLQTTRMKAELLMGLIARREHDISKATAHFHLVAQETALQPSPFLEMEAHIKLYELSSKHSQPDLRHYERALALLDQISANSRHPAIRPEFEKFQDLCEKQLAG